MNKSTLSLSAFHTSVLKNRVYSSGMQEMRMSICSFILNVYRPLFLCFHHPYVQNNFKGNFFASKSSFWSFVLPVHKIFLSRVQNYISLHVVHICLQWRCDIKMDVLQVVARFVLLKTLLLSAGKEAYLVVEELFGVCRCPAAFWAQNGVSVRDCDACLGL